MNDNNVTTAKLKKRFAFRTWPLYQYDYGQVLKFEGEELPPAYEVHFSNVDKIGTAKTQIGGADGVAIPDEFLLSGDYIYVWVFLHSGLNDGETEYKIIIPVVRRAKKENVEPTPVQQDTITQAIAALNAAVASTSTSAESAAASEQAAGLSEQNAKASEEAAAQSETNAAQSASLALASKQAAATSETNARASEQNASASEGAAGLSQTAAASSAAEALASEQAAAESAASAAESESIAVSKAESASRSEATAVTSAEIAIRKAAEAAVSAETATEASAEAEEALRAIQNSIGVEVETLDPYSEATAEKIVKQDGSVVFRFGIPQGIPGGAVFN